MEIKIDRYTKWVLTLIAIGLFANAFKSEITTLNTPINPQPLYADNVVMGSTLKNGNQGGQRFITVSPDGKTVYYWFREEDAQWYDRDKVMYIGSKQVEN